MIVSVFVIVGRSLLDAFPHNIHGEMNAAIRAALCRHDAEFHRVERNEEDTLEAFVGGYDFEEAFLGPYQT